MCMKIRSLISSIYLTFFFSCVLYGVSTNDSWHPSLSFEASIKWQSRAGCVSTISQQSVHVRSLLCQKIISNITDTCSILDLCPTTTLSGQHLFSYIMVLKMLIKWWQVKCPLSIYCVFNNNIPWAQITDH